MIAAFFVEATLCGDGIYSNTATEEMAEQVKTGK
jgi:hypothetical protein